ncbi:hypothetical protein F5B20DRAFT_40800 [Whalleya microplaca]|nr:hypothetical protein F5B20DRAFT_40800 [Whalleya microplaca]
MAKFEYPYKKGVNITAWVLQILVCVILLAASAWMMTLVTSDEYDSALRNYGGLFTAAAGLQIGITSLTIILDIVEIVMIAKSRMPPALYLSSACVKTLIWVIIFVLNLVAVSIISIILTLILAVTSGLQLVYGAILIHRKRKGTLFKGKYAPAHNPENVEAGYTHNTYYPQQDTAYKPTAPPVSVYGSPQPPPQYGYPGSYELDGRPHA